MVENIKKVASELTQRRNDVCLFAILKMDDLVEKWSVVISGSWEDTEDKRKEVFSTIQELMSTYLTVDERGSVARIAIYPMDDNLIRNLVNFSKGALIENQKINGNFVFKGFVLESSGNTDSGICATSNSTEL